MIIGLTACKMAFGPIFFCYRVELGGVLPYYGAVVVHLFSKICLKQEKTCSKGILFWHLLSWSIARYASDKEKLSTKAYYVFKEALKKRNSMPLESKIAVLMHKYKFIELSAKEKSPTTQVQLE